MTFGRQVMKNLQISSFFHPNFANSLSFTTLNKVFLDLGHFFFKFVLESSQLAPTPSFAGWPARQSSRLASEKILQFEHFS